MITTHSISKKSLAIILGAAFFCLCCLFVACHIAEKDLFLSWQTEEYSHGFFIPFIALLIAGHKLSEVHPNLRPSWIGLVLLTVSSILFTIARLSAFGMAAQYGIVIALTSISLGCLGIRVTYLLAPSLIYLLFAIPLPHLLQATLSQDLQLLSSTLGVWPLDTIGIPVFQEGNIIDLGGYRLQVVEACSGLRYLFPLMSFGYLIALLLQDKIWKRTIIFLSTIPISIGLNALRITVIGITVDLWGQKMAEGFIHSFEGWVVFILCLVLLMAETWVLLRIGVKHGKFRYDYISIPHGPFFGSAHGKAPAFISAAAFLILALVFGPDQIDQRQEIIPQHPPFASFPMQLDMWQGHQSRLAPDILTSLNLSDYLLADYVSSVDASSVNLYLAYYDSQRVGTTTHSPSNCIPGGGWQITQNQVISIPLKGQPSLKVTRLVIRKDRIAEIVYYWFDERGRNLTETYYAKWYLLLDSLTMHRTDGALVRLVTPLADANNEDVGDQRLKDFLAAAYPAIKDFIPGAILDITTP